METICFGLQEY